ncbi:MAG: DUF308 domain-containing protein [Sphaerochaetaceae bacterium]|nr:DUF308 domain-containing protein [Sphaerochaetaceae bacterium]
MNETYLKFKQSRWFPLVMGLVSLVFGVISIVNPSLQMRNIALYIGLISAFYGLLWIAAGIQHRENKKLCVMSVLAGIVFVVAAVAIFANLEIVGKYLPTLVGFLMIISAIHECFNAVVLVKAGVKGWWMLAGISAVLLILGLVFLLSPGFVGSAFGIFTGVALVINGVSNLIGFIQYRKV